MRQSGLGIAGLILGILGLLFSALFIGIVPCIISIAFCLIVIFNKSVKHDIAIAGGICSIIGVIIFSWLYLPQIVPQKEIEMVLNNTYKINDIFSVTPCEGRLGIVVSPSNYQEELSKSIVGEDEECAYQFEVLIENTGTKIIDLEKCIEAEISVDGKSFEDETKMLVENTDGSDFTYDLYIEPNDKKTVRFCAFTTKDIYGAGTECSLNLSFSDAYNDEADISEGTIYKVSISDDKMYNSAFKEKLEFCNIFDKIVSEEIIDLSKDMSEKPEEFDRSIEKTIEVIDKINQMSDKLISHNEQWTQNGHSMSKSEKEILMEEQRNLDNIKLLLEEYKDSIWGFVQIGYNNIDNTSDEYNKIVDIVAKDIKYIIDNERENAQEAEKIFGNNIADIRKNILNDPSGLYTAMDIILDNLAQIYRNFSNSIENVFRIVDCQKAYM